MNGLYMLFVNFQSRNPNFHEFYEIVMRTEKKNYIRLPLICENSEFEFREFDQPSFGMPPNPKIGI